MPFVLLLYPSTKMPVAARYNASVGVTGRTQAPDEDARDALTWQTASSANADFVVRWSASDWLECPRERSSWRGKGRPRSKLWRIFAKVWFARLLNIRFTPTIAHHCRPRSTSARNRQALKRGFCRPGSDCNKSGSSTLAFVPPD